MTSPGNEERSPSTAQDTAAAVADPVWTASEGPFRGCSIAGALDVIGDRWSLLVIREVASGRQRFTDIAQGTGAPRDVLTARLRKLEAEGILERRLYQDRPARYEYLLTAAGVDLVPILLALREWGDRHVAGEPSVIVVHSCGARLVRETSCAACGGPVRLEDLSLTRHPAGS